MKKGIRIRLYPNNNQVNILNKIFGHARYVYNYFLNYPSSQTCSVCGKTYKVKANEIYHCPHCSLIIDRDYNAAINILNYGLSH